MTWHDNAEILQGKEPKTALYKETGKKTQVLVQKINFKISIPHAQINNLRQKLNLNTVGMNNKLVSQVARSCFDMEDCKKGNEKHSTAYRGDNQ